MGGGRFLDAGPSYDGNSEYYAEDRELMSELRWRRETEYKLLTVHIAVCSASFALMLQGYGKGRFIEFLSPIVALLLTGVSWSTVTDKIRRENDIYKYLGRRVVLIWEEYELFKPWGTANTPLLDAERSRKLGMGDGYKLTIKSVESASIVILIFSLLLLFKASLPLICWLLRLLSSC